MKLPRQVLALAAMALGFIFVATPTRAAYPEHPVKIVVGYPPGGGADTIARLLAAKLNAALGQPVVVENRAGADGLVAGESVAKSTPDGYTLLLVSGSHTINPALGRKMPYDTLKDFSSISYVAEQQLILVSRPDFPADNVPQLVTYLKAHPKEVNFGSSSTGTQLPIELFKVMSGTSFVDVPYKGTAPVVTDLLGGHIDLSIVGAATAIEYIKAGRLKALAIGGSRRSALFPDIPTMSESGLPGYKATAWTAVFAPAGTPSVIVERLSDELIAITRQPDFQKSLAALGAEATSMGPVELDRFVEADIKKWTQVVKQSGIKVE